MIVSREVLSRGTVAAALILVSVLPVAAAQARVTAFMQSVAEAAAPDRDIAEFYRSTGYEAIWTGREPDDRRRREAFLAAVASAGDHGLVAERYDPTALSADLRNVSSERELGRIEVAMSRLFLAYARDIQTGMLDPKRIDDGIVRDIPYRPRAATLAAFAKTSPQRFIDSLPPQTPEYARLMKEKMRFERLLASGGWGPKVRVKSLKPGASGDAVVDLRNRMIAMGYLERNAGTVYDEGMRRAVAAFQTDHGLLTDGVAGPGTMAQINIQPKTRLAQIIVAMERERWTNMDRGDRHVWVNLTDFHARIVDDGKVTFETRSVVGKDVHDRRSPEFSDVMEHMVVNPTWHVPRSIATKEYLPLLKQNPYAVGHLNIIDTRGRIVPRHAVDWRMFNERSFPFDMREPPNPGNALGLVKFMFPNRYNIYLHDTPAKSLFSREKRDFSHGCIRLNDPFDFAYTLLARQSDDPKGLFHSTLNTGRETVIELEEHIPVHLVYRTAFTRAKGRIQFRGDVYGRDAKIWQALEREGVALRALRG